MSNIIFGNLIWLIFNTTNILELYLCNILTKNYILMMPLENEVKMEYCPNVR